MNFDEYEQKKEAIYSEFAGVVKDILEAALAETTEGPRPQSIQCRGKAAAHLKPKLENRGILNSQSIEREIKDLAGARLIFYTNTDVDRFLNSRLIPDNFDVQWAETRIHHPIEKNAHQRYQAIHYTVCLNQSRAALPEYAKFKGMRCEIQIQTVLNHAWAETSHDILYKPLASGGFGANAMKSIEKRMMRIMDDYLLPAGYEFQKVQYDFQRLMQGKALFDRGVLETLAHCTDNNERHALTLTIRDNVLPHYDDIQGIYAELRHGLVRAVEAARTSAVHPIQTPFGSLPGKTAQDVTAAVVDILDNLRYIDIEGAFHALGGLFIAEQDDGQRKHILDSISRLASHNLQVWQQVGPAVQIHLTGAIDKLTPARRAELQPVLLTVWRQFLSSEITSTTESPDRVTFGRGATPASEALKKIRESAINGLIEFLDRASSEGEKSAVLSSLWEATRIPSQTNYSDELLARVLVDAKCIVELLSDRIAGQPYQLLEHIENKLLHEYRRALGIAKAGQHEFGCKELANSLAEAILDFRDLVNKDNQFVQYKALVGFESVFHYHWEDDKFDLGRDDQYRQRRIEEFVESITADNRDSWYTFIERCAATKSTDLAAFPSFGAFIARLAKDKPDIAVGFLERATDDLLLFMPAFLNGLFESGAHEAYRRIIETELSQGTHLSAIALHWSKCKPYSPILLKALLQKATSSGDHNAVIRCLDLAIKNHDADDQPSLEEFFIPAIVYLTANKEARWLHGIWFMSEARSFFAGLSPDHTRLVLDNILWAPEINFQVDSVLSAIAETHADAVWNFLGRRLDHKPEQKRQERYEALPYQAQQLATQLSKNAQSATAIVRSWYHTDDKLFGFRGARLLSIVFPDFPEAFANQLSGLVVAGSDDDIGFVLNVLQSYEGAPPATHGVIKELIERLPGDDTRLTNIKSWFESTGIVMGEFGIVNAFRSKKAELSSWVTHDRPKLRAFVEQFTQELDNLIASEQRRAEQLKELMQREFDSAGAESEAPADEEGECS